MGKLRGFVEYERMVEGYVPVEKRIKNFKELLDQEIKGGKLRVSDVFIQNPLRVVFSLLAIIIVLYISLRFFLFF